MILYTSSPRDWLRTVLRPLSFRTYKVTLQDKSVPLEKDFDPQISAMQDVMRKVKSKKNDLYDKTTLEFVEVTRRAVRAHITHL